MDPFPAFSWDLLPVKMKAKTKYIFFELFVISSGEAPVNVDTQLIHSSELCYQRPWGQLLNTKFTSNREGNCSNRSED